MKGLIAYCLRRIVRRGCHSCLRWYLSVLSRLIDTLDCYISGPKTFSTGIYSSFNFFFFPSLSAPTPPPRTPSPPPTLVSQSRNLDVHHGGSRSEEARFYLAPPGVYSESSGRFSQNMNDTEMVDTDDESPSSAFRRLLGPRVMENYIAIRAFCVNTARLFRQMYLFLRRLLIKALRRHLDVWDATVLRPRLCAHTFAISQCVNIVMKYATRD